jgi:hypothetical protein
MSTQPQIPLSSIFSSSLLAIIAWVFGLVMSIVGGHEMLTALRCGDTPVPMTAAQLGAQGPSTSDFVTLSDYELHWDGYVYWQDEQGRWTSCDVPLKAAGSSAPPRVLIRVCNAQSEADLRAALEGKELTGIVTGRGLFGEYGAALASYNPGIDPAACWIVTLGKQPLDPTLLSGIFAGGVALFALGIFLFVYVKPRKGPEQAALRMMSPLILVVDGLHALADWLPLPSRRVCGLVLFPPFAALAAWGSYRLWTAVQPGTSTVAAALGVEFPAILAVDFGVSFALVALSFVLVERPDNSARETTGAALGAGAL